MIDYNVLNCIFCNSTLNSSRIIKSNSKYCNKFIDNDALLLDHYFSISYKSIIIVNDKYNMSINQQNGYIDFGPTMQSAPVYISIKIDLSSNNFNSIKNEFYLLIDKYEKLSLII